MSMKNFRLFSVVFGLALSACSFSGKEDSGWGMPQAQESESLKVNYADFLLKPARKAISLRAAVEVTARPAGAKYLVFVFPDPATKQPRERKVVPLDSEAVYICTSRPLEGMEYRESYPVSVQLAADASGEVVLEELTQQVRFELPAKVAEQLGIAL